MNQILTFVAALALILSVNTASAGSNTNKAVALLNKQVDRALISELKLNEMEYIKLKDLNKSYQQEVEALRVTCAGNTELTESKLEEVNTRFQAELAKVLSATQINSLNQYGTIALSK
ncbi:hypothetical protein [Pontibacter arcticus]|uniref:Uncharacterized protein n=1 Tax=Pontibacter arcticus TaxID=2080288 RepID=A0A364RHF3_9BACT|nr:hypothetical protein [Pontibacter arcticus]RAU83713.1 hypothetical protein DP923_01175 [Pontibacter arcticus]